MMALVPNAKNFDSYLRDRQQGSSRAPEVYVVAAQKAYVHQYNHLTKEFARECGGLEGVNRTSAHSLSILSRTD